MKLLLIWRHRLVIKLQYFCHVALKILKETIGSVNALQMEQRSLEFPISITKIGVRTDEY